MGVELGLAFCYGEKRVEIFSYIDTSKCFNTCYEDLFVLDGVIPEKINQRFLSKSCMGDISESGYGDKFQLFEPGEILKVIQENMDKLSKKYEVISHEGNYMSSDLEDERVMMIIGMLEKLSLMKNGKVKVGLHWY